MIGVSKADDREECLDDKEASDVIRELILVVRLRIHEAIRCILLISYSLYIKEKIIFPSCKTPLLTYEPCRNAREIKEEQKRE